MGILSRRAGEYSFTSALCSEAKPGQTRGAAMRFRSTRSLSPGGRYPYIDKQVYRKVSFAHVHYCIKATNVFSIAVFDCRTVCEKVPSNCSSGIPGFHFGNVFDPRSLYRKHSRSKLSKSHLINIFFLPFSSFYETLIFIL